MTVNRITRIAGSAFTLLLVLAAILVISPLSLSTVNPTSPNPLAKDHAMDPARQTLTALETEGQYNQINISYYREYYDHLAALNAIQRRTFQWQQHASEVTLWLVVFVVISGVLLSALQLWLAFFRTPPGVTAALGDSTIEISKTNFRVTSSIVGIVILLISVGFLYLFLREVYTIRIIPTVQPSGNANLAATTAAPLPVPRQLKDFGLPPPTLIPPKNAVRIHAATPR